MTVTSARVKLRFVGDSLSITITKAQIAALGWTQGTILVTHIDRLPNKGVAMLVVRRLEDIPEGRR